MQDGKINLSENLTQEILNYLLQRPCGEVLGIVNRLFIEIKENKNGQPIS